MSYNKKVWKSGDRITKEALNNMENGIEAAHQNSGGTGSVAIVDNLNSDSSTSALSAKQGKELNNKMPAKSIVEGGKIYLAKEDGTKIDSGTELPAGGSTIEVVNNLESDSTTAALSAAQGKALNTQYKDIVNKTITDDERNKLTSLNNYDDTSVKNDIQTQKARIDSFTSLKEGSTTGDAELIDGRIGADGITYDNIGGAIRGQMTKKVTGIGITKIMTITQEDYNYSTKDPNTLYIISDTAGESGTTQQSISYLKNTGGNSYIDTGYVPKLNSKFELTVRDTSLITNNRYFGNKMFDIYNAGSNYIGSNHGNKYAGTQLTNLNSKHTYIRNATELYVDGELKSTVDAGTQVNALSIYLFGNHIGSGYDNISSEFTFFELKIYEDNTLVHHYKPRKSTDDVACIFDIVTQQYLYNLGTGTLEYGTEIEEV